MSDTDPVIKQIDDDLAELRAEMRKLNELRAYWLSRNRRVAAVAKAGQTTDGSDDDDAEGNGKRVRDYIARVLSGGVTYGPADIARHATDLGWTTDSKNKPTIVRNNLLAMQKDGEVEQTNAGWRLTRHRPDEELPLDGAQV